MHETTQAQRSGQDGGCSKEATITGDRDWEKHGEKVASRWTRARERFGDSECASNPSDRHPGSAQQISEELIKYQWE